MGNHSKQQLTNKLTLKKHLASWGLVLWLFQFITSNLPLGIYCLFCLCREIRMPWCKIFLAVIEFFGHAHSARRWSELRHVVVHVISVLSVIDALFAAVIASLNRTIRLIDFSTVASFLWDEQAKGRRVPPPVSSHKGKNANLCFKCSQNVYKSRMYLPCTGKHRRCDTTAAVRIFLKPLFSLSIPTAFLLFPKR